MELGEKVKNLRQKIKMTQGELAEDICTQSFISRLEKGNISPAADILYKLSERLGVDVSFFNPTFTERHDYFQDVYKELRNACTKRDYVAVQSLVKSQKNNPLFKNPQYQKIFIWHESLCAFFIDKDIDKALYLVNTALDMSYSTMKNLSEENLEILITKCNIFVEAKRYVEAMEEYKNVLKYINQHGYFGNEKIVIRIFYNYAYILFHLGKHNDSIMYCNKGITFCTEHHYLYALGDLYFMLAKNQVKQENSDAALHHLQQAKMAYTLLKSKEDIEMTDTLIKNINNS